jgi:microsomal epoxide hydrolase
MPAWLWQGQIERLSRDFHVVAVDPRAQGESGWTAGMDCSPERRADDLGETVRQLALGPVTLVGWSLGAVEAARWAARAPAGSVRGVILVDEPLYDIPARAASRNRFRAQLRTDRAVTVHAFIRGMFQREPPAAVLSRLESDVLRVPADVALQLLGGESGDLAVLSRQAQVPVLAILTATLADQGKRLTRENARARAAVVRASGHAVFMDAPDRFAGLVRGFVEHPGP